MSDQTTVEEATPRNRRAVAAIAAGIVVVLLLGWFLAIAPLLGGDSRQEPAFAQTPTPAPTATQPDEVPSPPIGEEAEGTDQLPIETYEVFLSRDPFEPIRPEADGGTTGGTTGTTATTTTTTGDGDGTTTGDGDGTTTGDGDGTTGTTGDVGPPLGEDDDDGDREEVDGREVVLIDVFEQNGQERVVVEVDGTAYEVGEGDEFAENFRVLSIDPPCATFLHGDDAFTLCEGERVLK